jgi:hypothetical protein
MVVILSCRYRCRYGSLQADHVTPIPDYGAHPDIPLSNAGRIEVYPLFLRHSQRSKTGEYSFERRLFVESELQIAIPVISFELPLCFKTHPASLTRQICDFGLARIVHTSAMSSSGHGRVQIEDEIDGKAPTNFGCPPVRDCQRVSVPLDSLALWNAKPHSVLYYWFIA